MQYIISGIQQIGIGVADVYAAFNWYKTHLGMDIKVFEEAAPAAAMTRYTGQIVHERRAILALNLQGGGGFEIWQYTSRKPEAASFIPEFGDQGILIAKLKCAHIEASFNYLKSKVKHISAAIVKDTAGRKMFVFQDPFDNWFQMVEHHHVYSKTPALNGGLLGVVIGVSDISRSKAYYSDLLGYNSQVCATTHLEHLNPFPGFEKPAHIITLTHAAPRVGPFSKLLGASEIELVQCAGYGRKVLQDRYWGDLGFIHLCFDVRRMAPLTSAFKAYGYPLTVDGGAGFEMGEAAGNFTYAEDPQETLIEFVETKKVPLLKAIGWYLNLNRRPHEKSLPDWMIKAMRFNRVS